MKKNIFVTLILNLLIITNLAGQDTISIENKYASYFELPREAIFLHLNKSTFIKGESIWFKGYIYNRKNGIPFEETSNVYVGLYNSEGKQLDKVIVKATDGYATGNFKIDSIHPTGEYYLKADTNWMRNFKEDDAFVQKIQFLNDDATALKSQETSYDLQILPEGGYLVNSVPGVIGVKLIDTNGIGVVFSKGELLDESVKTIIDFKSNAFGMARFPITPEIQKKYRVAITLTDGKKITADIPEIQKEGIVLKALNTPGDANVIVSIATNKATFEKVRKKPYHLLIHKDGKSKSSPFVFNQSEKEIIIPLTGDFLFEGVNIITLFDDNKNAIAERMVFNHAQSKPSGLSITDYEIEGDSISISLNLNDNTVAQNISVSVLPAESRAYNQKTNIFSEFLLKPYVKGYIENPAYYFKEVNRRKEYDLDLLLLTQGWSRYNWDNIFNNSPNPVFDFENGLTLIGNFNTDDIDKYPAFFIDRSKYHKPRVFDLENSGFKVPGVFYESNEKVEIQLIKKSGKTKTQSVYARTLAKITSDSLNDTHFYTPNIVADNFPDFNYELEDPETVLLDEVEIIGKSKEKQKRYNDYISRKNDLDIDLEIATKLPFVTDILRRKGFDVNDDTPGVVKIFSRRRSSLSYQQSPIVYFDDTRLYDNFDFLYQMRSSEVERIVVEPFGVSEGSRGAAGVIRIWSRKGSIFGDLERERTKVFIDNSMGYVPVKKYYSPKYQYSGSLFRYFGVVHWEPTLVTDKAGKVSFKILNTGLKEVSLFIEGMSKNGSLISTVKKLRFDKNN